MPSKYLRVVAAKDNKPAEIFVYGPIGKSFWSNDGVSAKDFTKALNEYPRGTKVKVRVNSQGGAVNEGLAMYNAIKDRAEDVTVQVDGYALSSASFLPLGAGRVISPKSSIWMIHEAWLPTVGNKRQLRKDADMLETHDNTLVSIYADKTGKSKAKIAKAMEDETWLDGEQAKAWGLADDVSDDDTKDAKSQIDFSPINAPDCEFKFKNMPQDMVLACAKISSTEETPTVKGDDETETKENMRKQITAELEKRGIAYDVKATDEQLLALLVENSPAPTPKPKKKKEVDPDDEGEGVEDVADLRKQIKAERTKRITAEVTRLAENKISNEDLSWWIALAQKDEEGTYAAIKKLPVNKPGGDPIGHPRVTVIADTPLQKIQNEHKTPQARAAAIQADWRQLFDDACARDTRAGREVMAANTYSATLVTSFLMDGAVTPLQNKFVALKAFSIDSSTDPYKPKAAAVIKKVTASGATQTDATNFESNGDSTVGPVSVTMHQYTQAFQVSNSDLNSGLRMEDLVALNIATFCDKVTSVAVAPITLANFGAQYISVAPGAFGFGDSATLQGNLKKAPIKNLILDGEYIAQISNTPGFFQAAGTVGGSTNAWKAFGWDLIALLTNWSGADANVRGLACSPQVMGGILGLPLNPPNIPGGILSVNTMTVPGLDITIAVYMWFNTSTRTMWCSYDIMAGFSLLDATAGWIIKSA